MSLNESGPRTDAGRALLTLAAYDGIALVAADTLCDRILAIEEESAAPLDAEDLGWVLYEMGVDDLDLEDARKLAAHIIVRLAARLSEGTDR